jgi:hypothetical protein
MRSSALLIRVFPSLCASMWLVATVFSQPAFADSDREPLILDTRTGIQDGQSGVVVQSAPLARASIVSQQSQPTIIVSPYIGLPAGASVPMTELRPRPAPGQ